MKVIVAVNRANDRSFVVGVYATFEAAKASIQKVANVSGWTRTDDRPDGYWISKDDRFHLMRKRVQP